MIKSGYTACKYYLYVFFSLNPYSTNHEIYRNVCLGFNIPEGFFKVAPYSY
jgi:hypothetical protein